MTEINKNKAPIDPSPTSINSENCPTFTEGLEQSSSTQIEEFFQRHPIYFRYSVARHYPLDYEIIWKFSNYLDWRVLSRNTAIAWTLDFLKSTDTQNHLNKYPWHYVDNPWNFLRYNKALPWSKEIFECFKDEWESAGVCFDDNSPCGIEFLKYINYWEFDYFSKCEPVALTWEGEEINLPWNADDIRNYKSVLNWAEIDDPYNQPIYDSTLRALCDS